jgi:two-component system OmpR family response regulator
LFLTTRDAITDNVWGLETGGGDYATKPFSLEELVVRLLRYLMHNPRRVLTRAQLLEHVWSYDFGGDAQRSRRLR